MAVVNLRPATVQDWDFLRRLNSVVYKSVVLKQFGTWDRETHDRYFEKKLNSLPFQVIECSGQRVGSVCILTEVDHIWLRDVQVCPEHQNRGIGTEIIKRLMDEADHSKKPLRLRVLTANRAKCLYERLGFRRTGTFREAQIWMEYVP